MSDEELKGLLLIGEDVEYQGILVRNYKLGEIFKDLKLDKYYKLISLATVELKDIIQADKVDINKLKLYDVLYDIYNDWIIEFLNTFTYLKWEKGIENGKFRDFVAYKDEKRIRFTEDKFDGFMELFKKVYVVSRGQKDDKYDLSLATTDKAREMMKEFAEDERQRNAKKSKITLNGIIAGICSTSNCYDFFNIQDLTMYQLMTIYHVNENRDNYQYIMQSAYVGMYDLSKTKMEDIHYCREVNI